MSTTERPGNADTLGAFGVVLGFTALLVGAVGIFLPSAARDGGASGAPTGEVRTVEVTLGDLFVKPSSVEIAAGDELTVVVTNSGALAHDLKLDGATGTALLDPGASQTVSLGVITAPTSAWCTVPGHREAGMEMAINVIGGSTADDDHGSGDGGAAGAVIDPQAEPTSGWQPRDPRLPPAPSETTHRITLHATEKVMEVAPGVTQEMWTFNDQVPGPILRGRVGDVFEVTLVNDGKLGHSIDFHASQVAWNDEMRTIGPGESLVYRFTAERSGIFMYHCGTDPALHHIGNGMYGAVVIDPPGLAPVAHEFALIQSELYLGPEGAPGDLTKMQRDQWDAVMFNGYVRQYRYAPIDVPVGERVRVWVLDAGPSENSSFHVVGTIFDTLFKEGAYLLQPGPTAGGSQVLDLQPAQGGFVETTFVEDGLYPLVTHKFSNVGKGALGLFRAGDGQP